MQVGIVAAVGLLGLGYVALLVRGVLRPDPGRRARRARRAAEVYHLVAVGAMLWAIGLMPAAPHLMGTTVSWVLAVLFGADALGTVVLLAAFPERARATAGEATAGTAGVQAPTVRRRDLWLGAVPHVVMDVGMVWMLVF